MPERLSGQVLPRANIYEPRGNTSLDTPNEY
jgi:hypothetical protein